MSATFHHSHLWQQHDLSDVDVILLVVPPPRADGADKDGDANDSATSTTTTPAGATTIILRQLPGHSAILSNSAYCLSQMTRWQQPEGDKAADPTAAAAQPPTCSSQSSSKTDIATVHDQRAECLSWSAGSAEPPQPAAAAASPAPDHCDDATGSEDLVHANSVSIAGVSSSSSSSGRLHQQSGGCCRPAAGRMRVELTLQSAADEPAAMAVLAALYGAKPLTTLLSELQQEQQLQAALLADLWQVPDVSAAAVQLLSEAAKSDGSGLTTAAVELYASLPAYPACLLPLLKFVAAACLGPTASGPAAAAAAAGSDGAEHAATRAHKAAIAKQALLSVLGDLESVWRDDGLKTTLLELPLPAMELLMSCDEIKVSCEDNAAFTVQKYGDSISDASQKSRALGQLGPLIRCQLASLYWLSAWAAPGPDWQPAVSAGTADPTRPRSMPFRAKLTQLLLMRQADPSSQMVADAVEECIPGAPKSWTLGARACSSLTGSGVKLQWSVSVERIKDMMRSTAGAAQQDDTAARDTPGGSNQWLESPTATAPLGGCTWRIVLKSTWIDEQQGSTFSVQAVHVDLPLGTFYHSAFTLGCKHPAVSYQLESPLMAAWLPAATAGTTGASNSAAPGWARNSWGIRDVFELGPMAGGWDEAAWLAKGLPASGDVTFTLHVTGFNQPRDG